jgi:hypothetical protein
MMTMPPVDKMIRASEKMKKTFKNRGLLSGLGRVRSPAPPLANKAELFNEGKK